MSDDDPCIEVRLTDGEDTRRFSIRRIAGKNAWVYSHTEAGFSIVVLESRLADGWQPT